MYQYNLPCESITWFVLFDLDLTLRLNGDNQGSHPLCSQDGEIICEEQGKAALFFNCWSLRRRKDSTPPEPTGYGSSATPARPSNHNEPSTLLSHDFIQSSDRLRLSKQHALHTHTHHRVHHHSSADTTLRILLPVRCHGLQRCPCPCQLPHSRSSIRSISLEPQVSASSFLDAPVQTVPR
ncbi:unnamed protein product, partial [Mycena citricolor]